MSKRSVAQILADDLAAGKRQAFVSRPVIGKTARKRLLPPAGKKTNVGDPNKPGPRGGGGKGGRGKGGK